MSYCEQWNSCLLPNLLFLYLKTTSLHLSPWTTSFHISLRTPSPSQTQRNGDQEPCPYTILNHIRCLQRLSLVAHSALKHESGLRIMSNSLLTWTGYQPTAKSPILEVQGFNSVFPSLRQVFLPWWKGPVYPPCNAGRGFLSGATHQANGTWSTHRQGRHSLWSDRLLGLF
jgi:hypothetical protein